MPHALSSEPTTALIKSASFCCSGSHGRLDVLSERAGRWFMCVLRASADAGRCNLGMRDTLKPFGGIGGGPMSGTGAGVGKGSKHGGAGIGAEVQHTAMRGGNAYASTVICGADAYGCFASASRQSGASTCSCGADGLFECSPGSASGSSSGAGAGPGAAELTLLFAVSRGLNDGAERRTRGTRD